MVITLGELAVRFGCELRGDPLVRIESVATLAGGDGQLGFIASPAWLEALRATRLAAVVADARLAVSSPTAVLVHRNPHATFARIAQLLHPAPPARPGVAAGAQVDATADVDASAEIGFGALVEAGASVGPRCVVGPYCIVGAGVRLGADTRLLETR